MTSHISHGDQSGISNRLGYHALSLAVEMLRSSDGSRSENSNCTGTALAASFSSSEMSFVTDVQRHVYNFRPARARRQGAGVPGPFRQAPTQKEAA